MHVQYARKPREELCKVVCPMCAQIRIKLGSVTPPLVDLCTFMYCLCMFICVYRCLFMLFCLLFVFMSIYAYLCILLCIHVYLCSFTFTCLISCLFMSIYACLCLLCIYVYSRRSAAGSANTKVTSTGNAQIHKHTLNECVENTGFCDVFSTRSFNV